jgi:hypothetical protein
MKLFSKFCLIAIVVLSADISRTQQTAPSLRNSVSDTADLPPTLKDPASEQQVREYLRLSGTAEEFRESWIASVDKNRSDGAPYWPESFWQAVKDEMQKTDLTPTYVALFQRGVSRQLMVLEFYREQGRDHFRGSAECTRLGAALFPVQSLMEKLKLEKTQSVVMKVYAEYKPQIKTARIRYLAEHPEFKDK